jgi:hypothetical protein
MNVDNGFRGHDAPGDQSSEGRDRQVEKKESPPAEPVGQSASQQGANSVSQTGGAEDQGAGGPCLARWNKRIRHTEDGRPHNRAADAHRAWRREQHSRFRRQPADHGESGEYAGA